MSNDSTIAQFRALRCSRSRSCCTARARRKCPTSSASRDALVGEALAVESRPRPGRGERGPASRDPRPGARRVPAADRPAAALLRSDGGRTIEVPALDLTFQFLRDREQDSLSAAHAADLRRAPRGREARRGACLRRLAPRARRVSAASRPRRAPGLLPLAHRARVDRRARGDRRTRQRERARQRQPLSQRQGDARPAAARRGRAPRDHATDSCGRARPRTSHGAT